MSVMIQIRNVPEPLHRKLKARAAEAGMSLSAFLLRDIAEAAERPSWEEFYRRAAELNSFRTKESSAHAVRAIRDAR